ncbi:hypothetical protein GCK32_001473 [Trichostrongylus colubriformis]|uniref:Uncharacterized protein n=1 Tax=Trichostrongylus colubriformis TaxID=6319 RepID=A0AAN8IGL1_TRICO
MVQENSMEKNRKSGIHMLTRFSLLSCYLAPSSFHVDVDSGWYDVVSINYDPEWVYYYNVTRQRQNGVLEIVAEGNEQSVWSVGFDIMRGFQARRECFSYKVKITLISNHTLESFSAPVCTGPGSKSAEQVKFWLFTTLVCLLLLLVFTVAIRHEMRREAQYGDRAGTLTTIQLAPRRGSREVVGKLQNDKLVSQRIVPLSLYTGRPGDRV